MGPTTRLLVGAGAAVAVTVGVDQATKALTRARLDPGQSGPSSPAGLLEIRHVRNTGGPYGSFGVLPTWVPAVGTAVIGGSMLALGRGSRMPLTAGIGAGLIIGGGFSNVIDRIHQGHVTDMLHTSDAFGYYNVADVALNVGLVGSAGLLIFATR